MNGRISCVHKSEIWGAFACETFAWLVHKSKTRACTTHKKTLSNKLWVRCRQRFPERHSPGLCINQKHARGTKDHSTELWRLSYIDDGGDDDCQSVDRFKPVHGKAMLMAHTEAVIIWFPNSIFARVGAFSPTIFKSDIDISVYHISCSISVRRFVEGKICRKCAQKAFIFNLLCVFICLLER